MVTRDDLHRRAATARVGRPIGWVIVGVCTLLVVCILTPAQLLGPIWDVHFGWIFRNTTTNGGDMGAHVWLPWFLEHNWFPQFRLSGWAPDWYAGFPVGQYYFPFPSLMSRRARCGPALQRRVQAGDGERADHVAGCRVPRSPRGCAPWPAPPAFAIAAFGMLVQERTDWNIYGGNIASTLAGEYSFEIALAFSLFALGALAYTLDTGKRAWLPAVLIALAVMSHVVVAIFVGVAALLLWLVRSPRRTWPIAFAVGRRPGAHRGLVAAARRHRRTRRACGTRRCSRPAARSSPVLDLLAQPGEAHDRGIVAGCRDHRTPAGLR